MTQIYSLFITDKKNDKNMRCMLVLTQNFSKIESSKVYGDFWHK